MCVSFCIRRGKVWFYTFNGRNKLSKNSSKHPNLTLQMTKCFPTRGTDTKTLFFTSFWRRRHTKKHKLVLSLFERMIFFAYLFFGHVTRNSNKHKLEQRFPRKRSFCALSLCSHTYIYIYIYSTDDDDVNDDVNEFRRRRFCAEFSAPVLCSV